jgi:large subunit ribosomal protein L15
MSINLSNLKPAIGSTKKPKRVGRGGKRGSYSGKGMKGQKSRSGVSGLKAMGLKQVMQSTPKLRGFKSFKPKLPVVNLSDLNVFEEGALVDFKKMIQKGILDKRYNRVKVLGLGKLEKKLIVVADAFSASAKEAIEKLGGKAELK